MAGQTTADGVGESSFELAKPQKRRGGMGHNSGVVSEALQEDLSYETISKHLSLAQVKVSEYDAAWRSCAAELEKKGAETLLSAILCGVLATLCTGPAVVGVVVVWAVTWLSGNARSAFPALALASLVVFAATAARVEVPHILAGFRSYLKAVTQYGAAGIYNIWIRSFAEPTEWLTNFPIGLLVASAVVLLRDARKRSFSAELLATKFPSRRRDAPLVRLRRWWLSRRPHVKGLITLGTDHVTGARVTIGVTAMLRHTLAVGSTGTGKTTTIRVLVEEWLRAGFSVVFVCGKGDSTLATENCALAERLGAETYLFDANDPSRSCIYNPVSYGDATSRANRVMAMSDHSEPFFYKINLGVAQTLFTVLEAIGFRIDFLQVARYLDLKSLLVALRRKNFVNREHVQSLANQIVEQQKNEQHIAGLRADIRNLSQSSLAPLFDTRDSNRKVIELAQVRAENSYVHFVLPALAYPDWTRQLGRLIVEDIKAASAVNETPWLIVLDEAHSYAAENLISLASMGRSFNLALVIGTQAYAQLQNVSAKGPHASFLDALLASINLHLIHALNAPSDAETAAALIGTAADLEVTAQTESDLPNSLGSLRSVRSYKHHPDRLKSLPIGEAIFLNKVSGTVSHVKVRKPN
ncbi:helicase HerA-like domain-containing protein [Bradyrhizobium sp. CB2312]|uniref:type IV secretory system conjugative DNA transfer family protein n=1 Tax=Bradyrhizobium sp. CB2312 TaxID=3039155 RepID=UPI0024B0A5BB|nr:helicase HerA-like domain-containing protein [Bradyrhizobium sp. CB2312]WFU74263.1 DUF853 family protein [Bradyrhizobium sp. CB2312]